MLVGSPVTTETQLKDLEGVMVRRLLALLFALPITAQATSVLITADLPTQRADGSALAVEEIAEIRVYGNYCGTDKVISVGPSAFTDNTVSILDSTTKPVSECAVIYQLTTVDTNGLESERSSEYFLNPPGLPTNVKITIEVSF